jgi:hypothetical protein
LIELIEKEVQSIEYEVKTYSVVDYADNIFKDKQILDKEFYEKTSKYTCPKLPKFVFDEPHTFDPEDEEMWQRFSKRSDLFIMDEASKNLFMNVSDLMQNYASNSESNENAIKFSYFKFDREKTEKLLKKCKKGNFKVNGVINMLMMIAVKDIYAKYGEELNEMNYMNSISWRQFLSKEDQEKFSSFSYMACALPISFKTDFTVDYMIENFWSIAKEESNLLHQKIANNQQFKRFDWGSYAFRDEETPCLYFSSNLGAFHNTENGRLLKIVDSLNMQNDYLNSKTFCFSIVLLSIDNQLCWSFYYNRYANNFLFFEMAKKKIYQVLDKIV